MCVTMQIGANGPCALARVDSTVRVTTKGLLNSNAYYLRLISSTQARKKVTSDSNYIVVQIELYNVTNSTNTEMISG